MDDAEGQMPQPGPEHKMLQEMVGTWKVACKFYMDPTQPPMETMATETVEKVGEFWVLSKYETNFMGAPFVGRCTMGYEVHANRFVSTWIDSMAPVLFHFTGKKTGNVLTSHAEAFSCMTQSVLKHRSVNTFKSKDEHVFEMFCTMPDGKEVKMMTSHYKRA